jgi:hypothetical protein
MLPPNPLRPLFNGRGFVDRPVQQAHRPVAGEAIPRPYERNVREDLMRRHRQANAQQAERDANEALHFLEGVRLGEQQGQAIMNRNVGARRQELEADRARLEEMRRGLDARVEARRAAAAAMVAERRRLRGVAPRANGR